MKTPTTKTHWFNLAALGAVMPLLLTVSSHAAIYTVTTTADSGSGSLRAAIEAANATPGTDTIAFSIPGTGLHTIQPGSPLQAITDPVVIDGYTQPGSSPNTLAEGDNAVLKIELDGSSAGPWVNGLYVTAGNSIIRGLVINRFGNAAIWLQDLGGNTIEGNFLGTDVTGTAVRGNIHAVAVVLCSGNRVGGQQPSARNLISGNDVGLIMYSANDNVVEGNFIGTDATGLSALGNTGTGVSDQESAGNHIGGSAPGAGNLISGNHEGYGIYASSGHGGTVIQGNKIGTDVTGKMKLGNKYGVVVSEWDLAADVKGAQIGGTGLGEGNLISGNDHTGLALGGSSRKVVQGNLIGTDVEGSQPLGNGERGIDMAFTVDCLIGGTIPEARNVISCNGAYGISISGGGAERNVVQGNFIGTDITGTRGLFEQAVGIAIQIQGRANNLIGGVTLGARNVISGNGGGVWISGSENKVQGNFIGTDVSGTVALGNDYGVYLGSADATSIGGVEPGAGNLISGNSGNIGYGAITMNGQGVTGTRVQGNLIGTDITGILPLGNIAGLRIGSATGSIVGGSEPGAGNVIAHSGVAGVWVTGDEALRNTIRGNSIFNNGLLGPSWLVGIDLGNGWGVTLNDPLDADTGPNNLQNFPTITSASASLGGIQIQGSLNSTPNTTFILDFYANRAAHASGYGEGETYLGAATVTTDANGDVSFSVTLPTMVPAGQIITATATDPDGNTSEFSGQSPPVTAACSITCPASLTVNTAPDATQCGVVVVFPAPTLNGLCGEVTCVPPSGSFFQVGTTTVRCTAAAGASCEFTVTVVDKTPPQITPPADIVLPCGLDLLVPVTFSVTATDNCDPAPVVTCSPATGSGFPVGTTTVTCTATDASGNRSTSSFTVTRAALGFAGFLPPIGGADATGGSFGNPVRTFKNGSTIPVKFTTSCSGVPVLTGIHRLQAVKYANATTGAEPIDATPQDAASTGNQFRLTDGKWHFNLDTKGTGMSVGVWQLIALLSDGSQHTVWIQIK